MPDLVYSPRPSSILDEPSVAPAPDSLQPVGVADQTGRPATADDFATDGPQPVGLADQTGRPMTPSEGAPGPGLMTELGHGIVRGTHQTVQTVADVGQLVGKATGWKGLQEGSAALSEGEQAKIDANPPTIASISEPHGFKDWLYYGAGGIGENLPMFAAMAVPGGAAVTLGRAGAVAAGRAVLERMVAQGASREVAEAAANKVITKRIAGLAAGGGFAGSGVIETGSIYGQTKRDTGVDAPLASVVGGAAAGAFDVLPGAVFLERALGHTMGKVVTNQLVKRLGADMAGGVLMEGPTEGLQTIIENLTEQIGSHGAIDKNTGKPFDAFSPENMMSAADAAVQGAMLGLLAGGASGVVGRSHRGEKAPPAPSAPVSPAAPTPPAGAAATAVIPPAAVQPATPPPAGSPPAAGPAAAAGAPVAAAPITGTRAAPVVAATAADVVAAGSAANPAPTDGQIAAGNYQKGHLQIPTEAGRLHGTIETTVGETRRSKPEDPQKWEVKMPVPYGYVKATEGMDGEQVDAYFGPQPTTPTAFVIDQVHADTGKPDEHKAMIGFPTQAAAVEAYTQAFSDGRGVDRIGAVTPMPTTELRSWLLKGNTKAPVAPQVAEGVPPTNLPAAVAATGITAADVAPLAAQGATPTQIAAQLNDRLDPIDQAYLEAGRPDLAAPAKVAAIRSLMPVNSNLATSSASVATPSPTAAGGEAAPAIAAAAAGVAPAESTAPGPQKTAPEPRTEAASSTAPAAGAEATPTPADQPGATTATKKPKLPAARRAEVAAGGPNLQAKAETTPAAVAPAAAGGAAAPAVGAVKEGVAKPKEAPAASRGVAPALKGPAADEKPVTSKPVTPAEKRAAKKVAKAEPAKPGDKLVFSATPGSQPRIFYRGQNDGDTRRISTGDAAWDSHLFLSSARDQAEAYGKTITRYVARPDAKIAYEGTAEFRRLAVGLNSRNLLERSSEIAKRARAAGYDAVHFQLQGTVGTAVINRDAFVVEPEKSFSVTPRKPGAPLPAERRAKVAEAAAAKPNAPAAKRAGAAKPPVPRAKAAPYTPADGARNVLAAESGKPDSLGRFFKPNVAIVKERVRKFLGRRKGTGDQKNRRMEFRDEKGVVVIGKLTPDDWVHRVETTMTQAEITAYRNWYPDTERIFRQLYGADWEMQRMAWLLGNVQASPKDAAMNALRAQEQEVTGNRVLEAGVNDKFVRQLLRGEAPAGGAGQKILDFIDAAIGAPTRSIMGDDPQFGGPAPMDRHAMRDVGYVDGTFAEYLSQRFGRKSLKAEVDSADGSWSMPAYEVGAQQYRRIMRHLNDINFDGGGWTEPQVQAVGWRAISRLVSPSESAGAGSMQAILGNLHQLSFEAVPSPSAPMAALFAKYAELPFAQQRTITDKLLSDAMTMAREMTGVREVVRVYGTGGWTNPDTNVQSIAAGAQWKVLASLEAPRGLAAILGYLAQQDAVFTSQPDPKGKTLALDLLQDDGGNHLADDLIVMAYWKSLADAEPLAGAGYHPISENGKPGIRLVLGEDTAQLRDRIEGLWQIARLTAQDMGFDVVHAAINVKSEMISNDWSKQSLGEGYQGVVREAFGPSVSGRLVDHYGPQYETSVRAALAAGKRSFSARPQGQVGQDDARATAETAQRSHVTGGIGGDGRAFSGFFANITDGLKGKPDTGKAFEPVLDVRSISPFVAEYNKHRGNFDDHIGTSIPTFRELQTAVGDAIVKTYGAGATMLDIGMSEGALIKSISALSGGRIQTLGIDPLPSMVHSFDTISKVPGAKGQTAAYGTADEEGRTAWHEDPTIVDRDGEVRPNPYADQAIPFFTPQGRFDVVHEAMVFQFISNARDAQIARARELMKPGGVLILEEKFTPGDGLPKERWGASEIQKDAFKEQYFSKAEIAKKQKAVLAGAADLAAYRDEQAVKEQKVVGMNDTMVSPGQLEGVLRGNFSNVVQFWDSGNFKGYLASDDPAAINRLLANMVGLNSEFSTTVTPRQVAGGERALSVSPRQLSDGDKVKIGNRTIVKNPDLQDLQALVKEAGYAPNSLGAVLTSGGDLLVTNGNHQDITDEFGRTLGEHFTLIMVRDGTKFGVMPTVAVDRSGDFREMSPDEIQEVAESPALAGISTGLVNDFYSATPAAEAIRGEMRAEINRIVNRVTGGKVKVELHDVIRPGLEEADAVIASGGTPGQTVAGYADWEARIIGLAMADPEFDPVNEAGHESWHMIEFLGLVTPQEMAVLRREEPALRALAAKEFNLPVDHPTVQGMAPHEVRAIAFARYRRLRDMGKVPGMKPAILRAFNRVYQMLKQVAAWVRGHGFADFNTVFERANRGQIGARTEPGLEPGQRGRVFAGGETGSDSLGPQSYSSVGYGPMWYSQLERGLSDLKIGAATSVGWKEALTNLKKNGLKDEELDWSGLREWLDEQGQRRVSKDEVLAYVQANTPDMPETVLGESEQGDDVDPHYQGPDTTLPGGENYRELLFHMPEQPQTGEFGPAGWSDTNNARSRSGDANYNAPHFDDLGRNLAMHVRFDERTDAKGRKVIFVQEFQSDLHQAGRKYGYKTPGMVSEYEAAKAAYEAARTEAAAASAADGYYAGKPEDVARYNAAMRQIGEAADRLSSMRDRVNNSTIPDAPLKKTWHEFLFKRMLRWAAQNGYDGLAWTAGSTQNDRYKLSKHVDELELRSFTPTAGYQDNHDLIARKSGRVVAQHDGLTADKLREMIGKETADKLLAEKSRDKNDIEYRHLRGLDLDIGVRSGMTGFYDKMLPTFAAKYAKKWGSAPERTTVPVTTDNGFISRNFTQNGQPVPFEKTVEQEPAHVVPITDAMRESIVRTGQPLFSATPNIPASMPLARDVFANVIADPNRNALTQQLRGATSVVPWHWKIQTALSFLKQRWADAAMQGALDQYYILKKKEIGVRGHIDHTRSPWVKALMTNDLMSTMAPVMGVKVKGQWAGGALKYNAREGVAKIDSSVKPFMAIFDPIAKAGHLDAMQLWMAAKRTQVLIAEDTAFNAGKPTNEHRDRDQLFKNIARQKGISRDQLLSDLIRETEQPSFAPAQAEWAKLNKAMLDFAQQAGIVNAESRKTWERDSYVPFYRAIDILGNTKVAQPGKGKGLANQSSGIRQLHGGAEQLNDLVVNMAMNLTKLTDASLKNMAAQAAIPILLQTGDLTRVPMSWRAVHVEPEQLAYLLESIGVQVQGMTQAQKDEYLRVFQMAPPKGLDILSVMVDGKAQYYRVGDPLAWKAMTNLGVQSFTGVTKWLGWTKRLLTHAVTLDPAFAIANGIRDTLSTMIISNEKMIPFASAARGFGRALAKDGALLSYMAAGGGGGGLYQTSPEDIKHKLGALDHRSILTNPGKAAAYMGRLYHGYERVLAATEMANRLALYEAVIARGGSEAEAVITAKNILNFTMRGDWAVLRFLTETVPFLNARLQGLYVLGRAVKEHPVSFAIKGAAITAATMALFSLNHDDQRWRDLEEWDKDTYYHVWLDNFFGKDALKAMGLPSWMNHIRIPKPFEVGALFSTVPERAAALYEGEDVGRVAQGQALAMLTQTFAFNPMPQAMMPVIEQWANKSFFTGRPIVGIGLENLPPELQYNPTTSETARVLGGAMGIAPVRLESLVRGYTGNLGAYILDAADMAVRYTGDYPNEPRLRVEDMPVVARFFRDEPAVASKWLTEFYDTHTKIDQIWSGIREARRRGEVDTAMSLRTDNAELLRLRPQFNAMYQTIIGINKAIRATYANRKLGSTEMRDKVDQLLARRNDIVRRIEPKLRPAETGSHIDALGNALASKDIAGAAQVAQAMATSGTPPSRQDIVQTARGVGQAALADILAALPSSGGLPASVSK